MFYSIDFYAFPLAQRVPVEYNGVVFRVYTHSVHPGYARLIKERSGEDLRHLHDRRNLGRYYEIHGPAERYRKLDDMREDTEHVYYFNSDVTADSMIPVVENVYAVHCPYWPVEASEWITRTRRHACPSKAVIKQVVRYGCDFVGVAHRLSCNRENEKEWRFSFSMAELIIIRSWTSSQRIAYRVLRLVYKMIAQKADLYIRESLRRNRETVLCTYYFKTLMMWACEEQPEEFWVEHSLVHSIQQLLIEMAEWLKSKFCWNYFIRDNNMMDHMMDTDVSRDVADLFEISASRDLVARAATLCADDESLVNTLYLHSDLPTWILRCILIHHHVLNFRDNHRNLGSNDFSLEFQTALVQELTDVYRGLACHKEAVIRDAVEDKCLRRAERHFSAATRLHQRTERAIFDINEATGSFIDSFFIDCNADYKDSNTRAVESVTEQCALYSGCNAALLKTNSNCMCLLYSRIAAEQNKDTHSVIQSALLLVVYVLKEQPCVKYARQFYRQQPGLSPSVNASWFIAKSYLANLYYTQRHYKAALETCDEVVDVCNKSWGNKELTENTFPVLLSTQWTAVYDAELQALLGLCSLCAFVSNRTDARSVCLAMCPVQFALYLKVRCDIDRSGAAYAKGSMADFIAHNKQCNALFISSELNERLLVASLRSHIASTQG